MNKIKLFHLTFLFALTTFAFLNCAEEPLAVAEYSESPYKGDTWTVSGEQVWSRNHNARKISQAYMPYTGDHLTTDAFIETSDDKGPIKKIVGSGFITNNILSFTVNQKIDDDDLLPWSNLADDGSGKTREYGWKAIFREWPDAGITNKLIRANMILIDASSNGKLIGMMDRQRIYGDSTTITCETIMYIYVNRDCRITGISNQGYVPEQYYYYTKGDLSLTLKKGINLISRTETYGKNFNGTARVSMEIKNITNSPNEFKWTMEPGFGLPGIHY